jgi:co-chaperonin GroES (HSP10)
MELETTPKPIQLFRMGTENGDSLEVKRSLCVGDGDAVEQYNGNELKWEDCIKIVIYEESVFGEIQKHIDQENFIAPKF